MENSDEASRLPEEARRRRPCGPRALGRPRRAAKRAGPREAPAVHTGRPQHAVAHWCRASRVGLDTIYGGAQVLCRAGRGPHARVAVHGSAPYPMPARSCPVSRSSTPCSRERCRSATRRATTSPASTQALAFDTAMPFGLTARQQIAWLHQEGGGLELMREVYSDFNIISFPAATPAPRWAAGSDREVETVADLQGLKMRIPGLGGEVMDRLGVTVQVLAGGDIYPASSAARSTPRSGWGPTTTRSSASTRSRSTTTTRAGGSRAPTCRPRQPRRPGTSSRSGIQEIFAGPRRTRPTCHDADAATTRATPRRCSASSPRGHPACAPSPRRSSRPARTVPLRRLMEEEAAARTRPTRKIFESWKQVSASRLLPLVRHHRDRPSPTSPLRASRIRTASRQPASRRDSSREQRPLTSSGKTMIASRPRSWIRMKGITPR